MNFDLLKEYIRECLRLYRCCSKSLGLEQTESDLYSLLKAARNRTVERCGTVTVDDCQLEYHIHGSGYTFRAKATGKVVRFNVFSAQNSDRLQFTPWEVFEYCRSRSYSNTESEIALGLRQLSADVAPLSRVEHAGGEYYHCGIDVVTDQTFGDRRQPATPDVVETP